MSSTKTSFSIIPQPASLEPLDGCFCLEPDAAIETSGLNPDLAGKWNQSIFHRRKFRIQTFASGNATGRILLEKSAALGNSNKEGYSLRMNRNEVVIRSASEAGLFYGFQTFQQLIPGGDCGQTLEIPCVMIEDRPRFSWRGLMLDTCRHFFPVQDICRLLEVMAFYKLNIFHWHLTEDQGWRIEIKKYPRLTELGAWRKESPRRGNRNEGDGARHGGFYTQEQIREVVRFAQDRFITIVPEIEMPGHSTAALAAYPHLSCTGGPFETITRWGIFKDVYCAGKDSTFEFLESVFDEVLQLFPGEFIHVGGDECPKDRWRQCPDCQSRMRRENLKDEDELQSWFIRRMERYFQKANRRFIGWDEILEGGLASSAAVMSWRGESGGIRAASEGHDVVMTPTSALYFDYYQSQEKEKEPEAIGGYLPWEQVYQYDPVPEKVPAGMRKHILGAQGNLWSEYLFDMRQVEYMAFPRALALAELVWTPKEGRNMEHFRRRMLAPHLKTLEEAGINYRKPH